MKFVQIIQEAGINPKDLPRASELSIVLYDGKKREIQEETICFAEPIFEKNFKARIEFLRFLIDLEDQLRQNEDWCATLVLHVQLTEALVLVGSGVSVPHLFSRLP